MDRRWSKHLPSSASEDHGASWSLLFLGKYLFVTRLAGLLLVAAPGIAVASRLRTPVPLVVRAGLLLGLAATGTANAWSGAGAAGAHGTGAPLRWCRAPARAHGGGRAGAGQRPPGPA